MTENGDILNVDASAKIKVKHYTVERPVSAEIQ